MVIVGYNLTGECSSQYSTQALATPPHPHPHPGEVPYWIVRNTWGTDWGVDGYVLLKYGVNICGEASHANWLPC